MVWMAIQRECRCSAVEMLDERVLGVLQRGERLLGLWVEQATCRGRPDAEAASLEERDADAALARLQARSSQPHAVDDHNYQPF